MSVLSAAQSVAAAKIAEAVPNQIESSEERFWRRADYDGMPYLAGRVEAVSPVPRRCDSAVGQGFGTIGQSQWHLSRNSPIRLKSGRCRNRVFLVGANNRPKSCHHQELTVSLVFEQYVACLYHHLLPLAPPMPAAQSHAPHHQQRQ